MTIISLLVLCFIALLFGATFGLLYVIIWKVLSDILRMWRHWNFVRVYGLSEQKKA